MQDNNSADIEKELDQLYQASLADFIRLRTELAASLRKSGNRQAASLLKTVRKPSLSAWAVNQLFWQHRPDFEELIVQGDRLRESQRQALISSGSQGDQREIFERRRKLTLSLSRRAAQTLSALGLKATDTVLRRVVVNLEALAAYGSSQAAPTPGRLSEDLDPPGFEALLELAPTASVEAKEQIRSDPADISPKPAQRPSPRKQNRQLEAARARIEQLSEKTALGRARLEEAQTQTTSLSAKHQHLIDRISVLENRLRRARKKSESLERRLRELGRAEEAARTQLEETLASMQEAQQALAELTPDTEEPQAGRGFNTSL